jgi:uridine kinase
MEDSAWTEVEVDFTNLISRITAAPTTPGVACRIIAVDGCGGAGKTRLATYLSDAIGCPIVHTDDFASPTCPLDWYQRAISEFLEPVCAGRVSSFRRTDWICNGKPGDILTVNPSPLIIFEGVSASRRAFDRFLTFRLWVATPRTIRLQRGILRDGEAMRAQWLRWMDEEDSYVAAEHPDKRADVIVSGNSQLLYDPFQFFIARVRTDRVDEWARITAS